MDKIKILKVEPGKPPCVKEIANDFKIKRASRWRAHCVASSVALPAAVCSQRFVSARLTRSRLLSARRSPKQPASVSSSN